MQIGYAVFRWESALTLAATLILVAFVPDPFQHAVPFWKWWFWLVLGIVAETLILATTAFDAEVNVRFTAEALRRQFDPARVASLPHRRRLVRALEYRERMESLRLYAPEHQVRNTIDRANDRVSDWLAAFYDLAVARCAESLLDSALDEMDDIYVRMQLLQAQDVARGHGARLCQDIAAQAERLWQAVRDLDEEQVS